jgi:hypothetical protein
MKPRQLNFLQKPATVKMLKAAFVWDIYDDWKDDDKAIEYYKKACDWGERIDKQLGCSYYEIK